MSSSEGITELILCLLPFSLSLLTHLEKCTGFPYLVTLSNSSLDRTPVNVLVSLESGSFSGIYMLFGFGIANFFILLT